MANESIIQVSSLVFPFEATIYSGDTEYDWFHYNKFRVQNKSDLDVLMSRNVDLCGNEISILTLHLELGACIVTLKLSAEMFEVRFPDVSDVTEEYD